jgi:hypothetical protein
MIPPLCCLHKRRVLSSVPEIAKLLTEALLHAHPNFIFEGQGQILNMIDARQNVIEVDNGGFPEKKIKKLS